MERANFFRFGASLGRERERIISSEGLGTIRYLLINIILLDYFSCRTEWAAYCPLRRRLKKISTSHKSFYLAMERQPPFPSSPPPPYSTSEPQKQSPRIVKFVGFFYILQYRLYISSDENVERTPNHLPVEIPIWKYALIRTSCL